MRNTLLTLCFAICLCLASCNHSNLPSGEPFDVLSESKYTELISKCDYIANFKNGFAMVHQVNRGYGLVNHKGKIVLPCDFSSMTYFNENCYVIEKNNKYGLCNNKGKIITDCQYSDYNKNWLETEDVIPFALNGKWGLVSTKTGKQTMLFKFDSIEGKHGTQFIASLSGHSGVVDMEGKTLIPFKYDGMYFTKNGYIVSKIGENSGVIDSTGNVVLECNYDWVLDLGESKWARRNNKWALLSENYRQISECKYDMFSSGNDGVISLSINRSLHGALDEKTGKELIPFVYSDLGEYSEGLFAASKKINGEEKYGYIDINNNVVLPFIYDGADDFSEGLACVHKASGTVNSLFGTMKNKKCGFIDKEGNVIIPFKFQWQFNSVRFSEGLAAIGQNKSSIYAMDNIGYINKQGEFVIKPQYESAGEFKDGLALVKQEGKYGYIKADGSTFIACMYDDHYSYDQGVALAKDGIIYYFDRDARVVDQRKLR